jgi:elongator complex protein 3
MKGTKIMSAAPYEEDTPRLASGRFIPEIRNHALIREVHVYGQALDIGEREVGKPQHYGIGKELIKTAEKTAREEGFEQISVISAIGTREYYRKLGYTLGNLYMSKGL